MTPKPLVRPLKIAILAMGGEGGGVLADWIVSAAEEAGFFAQSTSVPGVAQRTGATIYYLEVLPVQRQGHPPPVFCLMPTPGDVDVVLASELMESARAVQRGLVTTDKTLLITSSSRVYSLAEKMGMSDGRMDSEGYLQAGEQAAKKFVVRDFVALAAQHGSVISAPLLGALAASGVLPLQRGAFEAAIQRGGIGVATSLKAFGAGFNAFLGETPAPPAKPAPVLDPRLAGLAEQVARTFPAPVQSIVLHGVVRTADYQGLAYAAEYLARLETIRLADAQPDPDYRLLRETARYLALWMSYEDTARVAELKLRKTRFQRIHQSLGVQHNQMVRINEFFHPRLEEIADTLPAGLGRWLTNTRWASALVQRFTTTGRVIRTSSLSGFLMLYVVSRFKGIRPRSLRYARETAGITHWLGLIRATAGIDYDLACELAECQRLIKGYGDTHARGMKSYHAILTAWPTLPRPGAAAQVKQMRLAALADESGSQLQNLMASMARSAAAARPTNQESFA